MLCSSIFAESIALLYKVEDIEEAEIKNFK